MAKEAITVQTAADAAAFHAHLLKGIADVLLTMVTADAPLMDARVDAADVVVAAEEINLTVRISELGFLLTFRFPKFN